jgi:plastocyanin
MGCVSTNGEGSSEKPVLKVSNRSAAAPARQRHISRKRILGRRRGWTASSAFVGFTAALVVVIVAIAVISYVALTGGTLTPPVVTSHTTQVSSTPSTSAVSTSSSASSGAVTSASSNSASSVVTAVSIPSGAGNPSNPPGYAPDTITVVMGVNNTVTWTNDDTAGAGTHHTVTSTSVPSGASSFNSGDMAPGAKYTYTFTAPGTYQYDCEYHSWMVGTVVVKSG